MKAYSPDLRRKVVQAYENQEGTQQEIAERFAVSRSFVMDMWKRYQATGDVQAKAHGGGNPGKMTPGPSKLKRETVGANESLGAPQKNAGLFLLPHRQTARAAGGGGPAANPAGTG